MAVYAKTIVAAEAIVAEYCRLNPELHVHTTTGWSGRTETGVLDCTTVLSYATDHKAHLVCHGLAIVIIPQGPIAVCKYNFGTLVNNSITYFTLSKWFRWYGINKHVYYIADIGAGNFTLNGLLRLLDMPPVYRTFIRPCPIPAFDLRNRKFRIREYEAAESLESIRGKTA